MANLLGESSIHFDDLFSGVPVICRMPGKTFDGRSHQALGVFPICFQATTDMTAQTPVRRIIAPRVRIS